MVIILLQLARQLIVSGSKLYCSIVEEMVLQFHQRVNVDRWHGELWMWMVKFKDVVFSSALQVDFVMEMLSKLVNRQVWRMPKLWVGFLQCVSQTQPHSFHVLLQLPSPQLESALNKHAKLRGALAAFANQPSRKASLPRSTLRCPWSYQRIILFARWLTLPLQFMEQL